MFTKKNLHLGQHLIDYDVFQFHCALVGFGERLFKHSGISIDTMVMVKRGRDFFYYYNLDEWKKAGYKYFLSVYKKPLIGLKLIEKIIYAATRLYKFSQTIPPAKTLRKISNRQLYTIYQKFHQWHHIYWELAMTPNLLEMENSYLIDQVMEIVEKKQSTSSLRNISVTDIVNAIISPDELSFTKKKQRDYYRLLTVLKRKGCDRDKLIQNFYLKYCWLEYNWAGPVQDKRILLNEIHRDMRSSKNFTVLARQITLEHQASKRRKRLYMQSLKVSAKQKILIRLLERLYFSKAYRMDCSYFGYFKLTPVLQEIAKRLRISLYQARSIQPEEMKQYLVLGKGNIERLNERYRLSVWYWDGRQSRTITGDRAKPFLQSMTVRDYTKNRSGNLLRGQIAYRGLARGRVKIINRSKELSKFTKGDILVSAYTDPTLMPAITRAAAVVTDFGGMVCHAAIVSRELGIPCVVGTKVATKVFKDDDKVEVNADKGVVTKL